MKQSLCICLTPLHVLIAAKTSEFEEVKFSKGVYLTYTDNNKSKFYAKEMERFCFSVDYVILPSETSYSTPKHLHIFVRRLYFRLKFSKYGRVSDVYTGTSINHYLFALLSAISFNKLITFDDGIINIKLNSDLKRKDKWTAKLFLLLSGIKYWREKLISKSDLHYSIYSSPNVFANVKNVKLISFKNKTELASAESKLIKIFLGSPPEFSVEVWKIISDSVDKVQPNGYLPHPREIEKKISNVNYIDTPLVAEHYVLNLLSENPNVQCELYGYEGSALLNLAGQDRIKVFSVMPHSNENSDLINLMKLAGVSFMDGLNQ
jgi:N-acetyllactosaminide alpha-2,3-sialyltransferase